MRISTNSQTQGMLYSMMNQNLKIDKYQQQVASGDRYENYSDAPLLANQSLILNNSLGKLEQYQKNVNDASTYLSTVETTLGQVDKLLASVKDIALQAKNGTNSVQDLETYKLSLKESLATLEGLANTQFLGKYVFSGEKTQTKPYDVTAGVATYNGDNTAVSVRISSTKEMDISITGDKVFQSAFESIQNAISAIENGTEIDLNQIDKGLNDVIDARSEIGVRMKSAESYKGLYESQHLNLKTKISGVEDADTAEAMVNLTQAKAIQESILAMTSKLNDVSLLNYIK